MKKPDKEIIDKIMNSDDGLSEIIREEIEKENKEKLSDNNKEYNEKFNYNDKNLKKSKYYEELEKEASIYLKSERIPEIDRDKKPYLTNIHKPIIKLLIAFLLAILIVKIFQPSKEIKAIEGLWLDENNIYYEIYDNKFEMNMGSDDYIIFNGNITNIVETSSGYIVLVKGYMYDFDINGDLTYDSYQEIVFTIKDYTNKLQTEMIGNLGDDDFRIVRCEDTPKNKRK